MFGVVLLAVLAGPVQQISGRIGNDETEDNGKAVLADVRWKLIGQFCEYRSSNLARQVAGAVGD